MARTVVVKRHRDVPVDDPDLLCPHCGHPGITYTRYEHDTGHWQWQCWTCGGTD